MYVLQVKLSADERARLTAFAVSMHLPLATLVRSVILRHADEDQRTDAKTSAPVRATTPTTAPIAGRGTARRRGNAARRGQVTSDQIGPGDRVPGHVHRDGRASAAPAAVRRRGKLP